MNIDQLYRFVDFVANKKQRGNLKPNDFNLLVKVCQIQFISKRMGNIQLIGKDGTAPIGYKSTRRIDEDLRPLVYGPVQIPIGNPSGLFSYPYGYIWPDSIHKNDFRKITIVDSDQYPFMKHSRLTPPTEQYPVCVFRGEYGFIDPYNIGSFQMSYLKYPPDPYWNYTEVNDDAVYNPIGSVELSLPEHTHLEVAMMILQNLGINLSAMEVAQYATMKEQTGT